MMLMVHKVGWLLMASILVIFSCLVVMNAASPKAAEAMEAFQTTTTTAPDKAPDNEGMILFKKCTPPI